MLPKQPLLRIKTKKAMARGSQLNDQRTVRMRLRGHQLLSSNQTQVSRSSSRVARLKMVRTLQSRHKITPITRITWMLRAMKQ